MTGPDAEQDSLLLRLRVAELEREVEETWEQLAARTTVLEDVRRTLWWKAGGPLRRVRRVQRASRPDVQAAAERQALAPGAVRIPLLGLHATTAAADALRWREDVIVDEVGLPALLADPPQEIAWRIIPAPGLRLRTFASLRPAAWTRNLGGVRFTAVVLDAAGAEVRATSLVADPGGTPEHRQWLPLELDLGDLPATEHRIVLRTALPEGAREACAWAVWGDPVVVGGTSPPAGPAPELAEVSGPPPEHPVVSLLVPVHAPDPALLDALLHSVRAQTSPHWQLCLCDDGSQDPAVRSRLRDAAAGDARLVLPRPEEA
ncbi:MAG: hypothetical protein ACEQSX_01860, partial [Baekduiaceae bacterium]